MRMYVPYPHVVPNPFSLFWGSQVFVGKSKLQDTVTRPSELTAGKQTGVCPIHSITCRADGRVPIY